MNRIDRLTAILIQLQTKRWVTSGEIADRYDISIRTVYRDLRALEEAGVPIGAEAGKGYFIVDGYHLPPVMFTREEAGAMVLAGKLIEKLTDQSLQHAYSLAIDKIKSVLPEEDKESLVGLNEQIKVFYARQTPENNYPDNFLSLTQKALSDSKCLQIDYHASYSQEKTKGRIVDPLGLVFYANTWHLIAFCKLRQEMRDFRLDRVMDMKIMSECASPKHPDELKRYFEDLWQTVDLSEAKVWFHRDVIPVVNASRYYFGYIDEELEADGVIMSFAVTDHHHIGSWLLSFAGQCKVVSPPELQEEILSSVRELAKVYL
ncbi:MAG: YafY family transcriptional regulator [Bacteroidales bacterium]|nr:YafY family transcriptional regulator [Bacteroidales bacterium]